jgi:hypothetical protein
MAYEQILPVKWLNCNPRLIGPMFGSSLAFTALIVRRNGEITGNMGLLYLLRDKYLKFLWV